MSAAPLFQRLLAYRWRILAAVAGIAVLYALLRPAPDPETIIRENIHSWVARLEKHPPEGNTTQPAPRKTEAVVLLEDVAHIRRLVRDAFTENATVRAARSKQEQGNEAITAHIYALRSQADTLRITLGELVIHIPAPADSDGANSLSHTRAQTQPAANSGDSPAADRSSADTFTASQTSADKPSTKPVKKTDAVDAMALVPVQVDAIYKGQSYTAAYDCELRLVRDESDSKWRISELTAQQKQAVERTNRDQ